MDLSFDIRKLLFTGLMYVFVWWRKLKRTILTLSWFHHREQKQNTLKLWFDFGWVHVENSCVYPYIVIIIIIFIIMIIGIMIIIFQYYH